MRDPHSFGRYMVIFPMLILLTAVVLAPRPRKCVSDGPPNHQTSTPLNN